ncbi:metallophosphoesterase [Paenibacillus sp. IB182496]|uniref:Metallophosphoesterase n=1 Tax=Paenibacillus sabuli TaxID=2772509 RepID=A0A927BY16_9BACL|nr:metallophosphoesterase [Paenibacillus sabuli]MBD2847705.1 metallophosphoesterase [Paenibacillus sabuli]
MFVWFGIAALLIYVLLVFYVGRSGWRWLRPLHSKVFGWLYGIVLAVVALAFLLAQWTGNIVLGVIGAYWMAVFCLLLMILPITQLAAWLIRRIRRHAPGRELWPGVCALTLLILLMAWGSYMAYSPSVRTYEIDIAKPAPGLERLTIAMASDMHFGILSGEGHARRLVRELNALEPDIVLLPGDIIDDDIQPYLDAGMPEILSGIRAPFGVYAVLGNHDRHELRTASVVDVLERSGIQVLDEASATIGGAFTLIGRRDLSDSERGRLDEAMTGTDPALPLILLDHQPVELGEARAAGIDLMLSGHTHRGQIFPGNLLTGLLFENHWGHLEQGNFHSVVSAGFGFWGPPIRLGSRSEIVRIELTFGAAGA